MKKRQMIEQMIEGKGVIIDASAKAIYRLAISPEGKARVCRNDFDLKSNTVLGPATEVWDYIFPKDAIAKFNEINLMPGVFWRKDERVFYQKPVYGGEAK